MISNTPTALITGGGRRIGAAICTTLHREGFNIVVHYHHSKKFADKLAHKLNKIRPNSAKVFSADLNNMQQIAELAEFTRSAWGRIDALINNASSFYATPLGHATNEQWCDLFNSNLKAPFFLAQYLIADLKATKGTIVNIADIFAERPMPNHAIYSMAKAGNRMLTQTLALELAPHIRVNGVAPGAILWPEDDEGNEQISTDKLHQIPLGRLGGTESIAETVLFLINNAPYITGQIIRVDGGRSLQQ